MATEHEITLPRDRDEQIVCTACKQIFMAKWLFDNEMEKFDKLIKHINDFESYVIDARVFKERVNEVIKVCRWQVFIFNMYMKNNHNITLPLTDGQQGHETGGKMTKVAENLCQLPWDVLDIISRKLDFDDFSQFSGVCKNWREFHKSYWRDFLVSQEPLIVRKSYDIKKCYTFISIPHQKIYHSEKMNVRNFNDIRKFLYFGSSSGYLIMARNDHSFVLINPFTRKVILIDTSSTFKVELSDFAYNVLLAFEKGSDEFVFVALCKSSHNLHIYRSQNFGWVTYSSKRNLVDFTLLHNAIYVITDKAKIGVFSLNSAYIRFLELKSTLKVTSSSYVRLIDCDGQLLVLNIISNEILNVYKIDFSTMNCVKLETLGDIALFYAPKEKYYALRSPEKWGYRRNSVYVIDLPSKKCKVYIGNDNELPKFIIRPIYNNTQTSHPPYLLDWYFRHQHYEVDVRTTNGESF